MVKRSKKTKRNIPINAVVTWLAIGLIMIIQALTVLQLIEVKESQADTDKRLMSDIINRAETNRYKLPVISVPESRVYIPEVRAYMPLTSISRDIRYDYFDMKGLEMLYLSYEGVVGHQSEYHSSANCDKIVAITKNKESMADFEYTETISPLGPDLKYVYQRNDCNFYTKELSDNVSQAAKSLRSY